MRSRERLQRAGVSTTLLTSAILALCSARGAIAGKMIFISGRTEPAFQLNEWFSPGTGILTLDPTGTAAQLVHVEILAPSGRSPASLDFSPMVLKRLTISRPTSINLARISHNANLNTGIIRIRVLAP